MAKNAVKIGLALGGGGARGWAHIGVIESLNKMGIKPDIVCGTSIGALVGAAYVSNQMQPLSEWVTKLGWRDAVSFLDLKFSGGFISGKKLFDFFRDQFEDIQIEDLDIPFASVATRLDNGQEIWLRHGPLLDAVRASVAIPGFFTPVEYKGHWIVDGGLANPVPISVCRAMGADVVIAVAINANPIGQRVEKPENEQQSKNKITNKKQLASFTDKVLQTLNMSTTDKKNDVPSIFNVIADSIDIMQIRLMRSRLAGDPPEILIAPQAEQISFLEFYRGIEAIELGALAVDRVKDELMFLIKAE